MEYAVVGHLATARTSVVIKQMVYCVMMAMRAHLEMPVFLDSVVLVEHVLVSHSRDAQRLELVIRSRVVPILALSQRMQISYQRLPLQELQLPALQR